MLCVCVLWCLGKDEEDWKKSGGLGPFFTLFLRNFRGTDPCRPIVVLADPLSCTRTAEEWAVCFLLLAVVIVGFVAKRVESNGTRPGSRLNCVWDFWREEDEGDGRKKW